MTIYILISAAVDSTQVKALSQSISAWFWLAVIEGLVIIWLIIKSKSIQKDLAFADLGKDALKEARKQPLNMAGLMDSIADARSLYKDLSRKCHPDLFENHPNRELAEQIFKQITVHQRNFEKLNALKQRASTELNIHF